MPLPSLRSLFARKPEPSRITIGNRDYTPAEVQVLARYNVTAAEAARAVSEARSRAAELRQLDMPRVRLTIEQWRRAIETAESVLMPSRYDWAQSVAEIELDGHVTAVVSQIIESVLGLEWAIVDPKTGKVDAEGTERLESPWVYDSARAVAYARFPGHSLFELGPYNRATQELDYVYMFPIEHVNIRQGLILPDAMNPQAGVDYRKDKALSKVVVEAFGDKPCGLYGRAGQYAVYKKLALAYWSKFGELAAVPLRWAKTKGDKAHQEELFNHLVNAQFANVLVTDLIDDEINFAPTNVTQPKQVFGELALLCNDELSKAFGTSPMMLDKSPEGGFSQTSLHDLQTMQTIKGIAHKVAMAMNRHILPRAQAMGWPVDMNRLRFKWVFKSRMGPKDQAVIDFGWHDRGWKFPAEYVRDTYGLEGEWGEQPNTGTPANPDDDGTGGGGERPQSPATKDAQQQQRQQAEQDKGKPTAEALPSLEGLGVGTPPFPPGCC